MLRGGAAQPKNFWKGVKFIQPNRPTTQRKPRWLRQPIPPRVDMAPVEDALRDMRLNTVCRSARCPNRGRCYSRGTATFMILGDTCTRSCRYCAVPTGRPPRVDPEEPRRVAEAARRLGLRHVVVTSVTRDDLVDGGAGQFAATVAAVRELCPEAVVELLVPDFGGAEAALARVLAAGPAILNHNVETVPRLFPAVRPEGDYQRSLRLLSRVKSLAPSVVTKSGLMLGLGEAEEEVVEVLRDLREAGCEMLTLGQYLQPSPGHLPVAEYVEPRRFARLRRQGLAMGFRAVFAGPLVRSSFHAGDIFRLVNPRT